MEKEYIKIDLEQWNFDVYNDEYMDIPQLEAFISDAKQSGATHINFYGTKDYDGQIESISLMPYREETAAEYAKRIAEEEFENERKKKWAAAERTAKEIELLKALKAKYEK